MQAGWKKIGNDWYYLNANGEKLTGWIQVSGNWYYLDSSGVMQTGWKKVGRNWYYMASDGAMQTGWIKIDNEWYYLNTDGKMVTGFIQLGERWYYFNNSGAMEDLSILDENPSRAKFIDVISKYAVKIAQENDLYASVITAQAALETGYGTSPLSKPPNHNLFGIKGEYNGQSVYIDTPEDDGSGNITIIRAQFKKYPSYMESLQDYAHKMRNGVPWDPDFYKGTWRSNTNNYTDVTAALTGTYATDTSYYKKLNDIIREYKLYELDGDRLVTNPTLPKGWNNIDGNWFYIGKDGSKLKGWQEIKNKWYYLGSNGIRRMGWIHVGNKWYYMDSNGVMQVGWKKIDESWYYMDADGIMQTGWIEVKDKWYYMNNSGVMQTGWLKFGNYWYYLKSDGSMQIGDVTIDGKKYLFDSSGRMQ